MRHWLRWPSPAMIVALVALFFGVTGWGVAAGVALVPRDSVGSAQIIDGSIRAADLHASTRSALKGADLAFYRRDAPTVEYLPAGLTAVATATCDPGDTAVSGTWFGSTTALRVVHTFPGVEREKWVLIFANGGTGSIPFITSGAVCADTTP